MKKIRYDGGCVPPDSEAKERSRYDGGCDSEAKERSRYDGGCDSEAKERSNST